MRRRLWWYAFLLAVFVIGARITHNGESAFHIVGYVAFAIIGLVLLLVGWSALRRRRAKRD